MYGNIPSEKCCLLKINFKERLMKKINNETKRKNAIELNQRINEDLFNYFFPRVKVRELSLEDEFLKYEPETIKQLHLRINILYAMLADIPDFRAQRFELLVDDRGKIFYDPNGITEAKTPYWWIRQAGNILASKESRIGTNLQRYAFYGVVLKELTEKQGYTPSQAWRKVCGENLDNNSFNNEIVEKSIILEMLELSHIDKLTLDYKEPNKFVIFKTNGDIESLRYPIAIVDSENFIEDEKTIYSGWVVTDV